MAEKNKGDVGETDPANETQAPGDAGFLRFYGLYWRREFIYPEDQVLAGVPTGWIGRGRARTIKETTWMNFWRQKGVYVLYDRDLTPVYAGQAGVERSNSTGGRTIGDRLVDHSFGKYRNGWEFFSWFGFLKSEREAELKGKLKKAARELRHDPEWTFSIPTDPKEADKAPSPKASELNALLDSFEAILIEAFVPRFNSRGGNLKGATYVDQLEVKPKLVIEAEAERSVPEQEH